MFDSSEVRDWQGKVEELQCKVSAAKDEELRLSRRVEIAVEQFVIMVGLRLQAEKELYDAEQSLAGAVGGLD